MQSCTQAVFYRGAKYFKFCHRLIFSTAEAHHMKPASQMQALAQLIFHMHEEGGATKTSKMQTQYILQQGLPNDFETNKLCGRPPQNAPAPCKLTFHLLSSDLESGVQVTCDIDYLCASFSLPGPLCSRQGLIAPMYARQPNVRRA